MAILQIEKNRQKFCSFAGVSYHDSNLKKRI